METESLALGFKAWKPSTLHSFSRLRNWVLRTRFLCMQNQSNDSHPTGEAEFVQQQNSDRHSIACNKFDFSVVILGLMHPFFCEVLRQPLRKKDARRRQTDGSERQRRRRKREAATATVPAKERQARNLVWEWERARLLVRERERLRVRGQRLRVRGNESEREWRRRCRRRSDRLGISCEREGMRVWT